MKFSERKGYKEISKIIQIDGMNDALKNSIWNFYYEEVFSLKFSGQWEGWYKDSYDREEFEKEICKNFLKIPLGTLKPKTHFFKLQWYEIYDIIEFTCNFVKNKNYDSGNLKFSIFEEKINEVLAKGLSGYRVINGIVTNLTNKQEIEVLEIALTDKDFPHVKSHLQRALELLSDRKNPDYRNSIKESISAVESIAKDIAQMPKAELGDALKEIEKQGKLHGAMKKAFLNLYGYTSDANGIRHALMEESNLTADDAKFFLLSCTSFINYLKAKM